MDYALNLFDCLGMNSIVKYDITAKL